MSEINNIFQETSKKPIIIDERRLLELLPHRYPMLLIDRVISLIPMEKIIAKKNVTFNEPFFQGHFPGRPVMPGVLIIEAMAQASGLLALESSEIMKQGKLFLFLSIDNAKFRAPVVPGDTIIITSRINKVHGTVCKFECEASVDDRVVSEASICAKVLL